MYLLVPRKMWAGEQEVGHRRRAPSFLQTSVAPGSVKSLDADRTLAVVIVVLAAWSQVAVGDGFWGLSGWLPAVLGVCGEESSCFPTCFCFSKAGGRLHLRRHCLALPAPNAFKLLARGGVRIRRESSWESSSCERRCAGRRCYNVTHLRL